MHGFLPEDEDSTALDPVDCGNSGECKGSCRLFRAHESKNRQLRSLKDAVKRLVVKNTLTIIFWFSLRLLEGILLTRWPVSFPGQGILRVLGSPLGHFRVCAPL